ncbi:unnamed protein product [Allacma fusca]|uniref:Secreted protein n=1 Tax=Allacma fusca TaxID=39272 RepID=A0A8J2JY22_9HEXA|nr:unnamed protein product [Allacma fusca]
MVSLKFVVAIAFFATFASQSISMAWPVSQPESFDAEVIRPELPEGSIDNTRESRMWAPWTYAKPAGRGRFHTGGSSY